VSHAGLALLRGVADRTGLTGGLSEALASGRLVVHDRGRVLADLACAIADGAEVISDFRVLGDQRELLGPVASVPTAWRTLEETASGGARTARRVAAAVNAARRVAWAQAEARHGALPGVRVADKVLDQVTCIRLDATVIPAHSEKQGAEPNFKGFGHHPLLAYCDNTREPLAGMLREGSAGSNTAADHIAVLDDAIAALPPEHRRRLMITCDGAGASHDLVGRLDALASRRGYQVTWSVGWDLGERERRAIALVPAGAWQAAVDGRGEVRERRSDAACADTGCGHQRCWIEEAQVTELTAILRDGRADQLAGWPVSMRVFARRERPHPGAQLTLLEAQDGWRYTLRATSLSKRTYGWRARWPTSTQLTGFMPGSRTASGPASRRASASCRRIPSRSTARGSPDRRHLDRLAPADRPGRRPGPRRAQDPALPTAPRRRPPDPRRPPPAPQDRRDLALGGRLRNRLGTGHRAAPRPLTSTNTILAHEREHRGPWKPPDTGPPAGPLTYPNPKIKIHYADPASPQPDRRLS